MSLPLRLVPGFILSLNLLKRTFLCCVVVSILLSSFSFSLHHPTWLLFAVCSCLLSLSWLLLVSRYFSTLPATSQSSRLLTHCSYDWHHAQPIFIRRVYTHGSVCLVSRDRPIYVSCIIIIRAICSSYDQCFDF